MHTLLVIIMILSGITFIGSVLLMSPKGGLGLGIGGIGGGGSDYGSKKSLEGKIKKFALVTALIFVLCAFILPYSK